MRRSGRAIDALLLVGGFSENPYLFKRVFERFRDQIPVIARPDDADTATNRGAAQVSRCSAVTWQFIETFAAVWSYCQVTSIQRRRSEVISDDSKLLLRTLNLSLNKPLMTIRSHQAKLPAEKLDEKMRPAYIQTNAAGARVCERR